MPRLKQIERRMLPHRAVLERREEGGAWEGAAVERTVLEYVRVDGGVGCTYGPKDRRVTCDAVLFYDCVYSRPRGLVFRLGDEIVFSVAGEERRYHVVSAFAVPSDSVNAPVHHWELGLV